MATNSGPAPKGAQAQEACYRWLKAWIASVPRDAGVIITEAEVSEGAQTGRTPAREALLRMAAEGFLEIVPRKGAFVAPVSDREIVAVMQARGLVEDWCVRRVAVDASDITEQLGALLSEQRELLHDSADFIEKDRQFHRAIIVEAGNPVLADFHETLRDRQMRMGLLAIAGNENRRDAVLDEHTRICEAVAQGDPEGAAEAMAVHLENTLEVLSPVRVAYRGG